jgi:hypothetical protein
MYTKDANGNRKQVTTEKSYGSIEGYKLGGNGSGSASGSSDISGFFETLITTLAGGFTIFFLLVILVILYFVFRKKSK